MCILVFDWQPGTEQPLLLLANRDEFHARPSAPLTQWADLPLVHAGRDLEAGGSWLGMAPDRRFATLTNIRKMEPAGPRSRGDLVSNFLAGSLAPAEYMQQLIPALGKYSGFNLLVGDAHEMWFLNSCAQQPQRLAAGIYALCNASLDTPWPKLVRLRSLFSQMERTDDQALFALMRDSWRPDDSMLPETGVGLAVERQLSSIFIIGDDYGTRATSLLRMDSKQISLAEQSFHAAGVDAGVHSLVIR